MKNVSYMYPVNFAGNAYYDFQNGTLVTNSTFERFLEVTMQRKKFTKNKVFTVITLCNQFGITHWIYGGMIYIQGRFVIGTDFATYNPLIGMERETQAEDFGQTDGRNIL